MIDRVRGAHIGIPPYSNPYLQRLGESEVAETTELIAVGQQALRAGDWAIALRRSSATPCSHASARAISNAPNSGRGSSRSSRAGTAVRRSFPAATSSAAASPPRRVGKLGLTTAPRRRLHAFAGKAHAPAPPPPPGRSRARRPRDASRQISLTTSAAAGGVTALAFDRAGRTVYAATSGDGVLSLRVDR
jgi:hypothetical protein